ncbi:MAG: GNAT family N-acetyltransferase [Bacteroidota bacterium]
MKRPIELSTKRTFLRLIEASDLGDIHQLHALPEVDEFNTLGIPESIEETKAVITPWVADNQSAIIKNYTFKIQRKSDSCFLGLFGLKQGSPKYSRAEVWYKLHPDYWRQGYATEVLSALLDFGFDRLHLHRIEAGCAVDNIGSIRVLEKVGMVREGRRRQILPLKSGWSDNFEYAILETDERKKV